MDKPTKNLLEYVTKTGANLKRMSEETRIPYSTLRASLSKNNSGRDLRIGEYAKICDYLNVDFKEFIS